MAAAAASWVPCCWIRLKCDFTSLLLLNMSNMSSDASHSPEIWDTCKCYNQQLFSIMENIFILGCFHLFTDGCDASPSFILLLINTKIKIMTIEGPACCFEIKFGNFNWYATLCWHLYLSHFYLARKVPITADFQFIHIAVISLE